MMTIFIETNWRIDEEMAFVRSPAKLTGMVFARIPMPDALRDKRRIIHCAYCEKPAVVLDAYFPYYSISNLCAEHRDAPKEGWQMGNGKRYAHYFDSFHSLCWKWETERYAFAQDTDSPKCATCSKALERRRRRA